MRIASSLKSLKKRQNGLQIVCRRDRKGKKRLFVIKKNGAPAGRYKARQG